jgi:hypothetical protein
LTQRRKIIENQLQLRKDSAVFWLPGRLITMAAPNRNYEIEKKKRRLFIDFPPI